VNQGKTVPELALVLEVNPAPFIVGLGNKRHLSMNELTWQKVQFSAAKLGAIESVKTAARPNAQSIKVMAAELKLFWKPKSMLIPS